MAVTSLIGADVTGVVIMCLRKWMSWCFPALSSEFSRFTRHRISYCLMLNKPKSPNRDGSVDPMETEYVEAFPALAPRDLPSDVSSWYLDEHALFESPFYLMLRTVCTYDLAKKTKKRILLL